jgi:hypothetical protein
MNKNQIKYKVKAKVLISKIFKYVSIIKTLYLKVQII